MLCLSLPQPGPSQNNKAFASQTRLAGHTISLPRRKAPKRRGAGEASLLFQRTVRLGLESFPRARAMLANYLELMCMLIFAAVHHRVGG